MVRLNQRRYDAYLLVLSFCLDSPYEDWSVSCAFATIKYIRMALRVQVIQQFDVVLVQQNQMIQILSTTLCFWYET